MDGSALERGPPHFARKLPQGRLHSTNVLERLNSEIERRANVVGITCLPRI
jgi:hypothetical protein